MLDDVARIRVARVAAVASSLTAMLAALLAVPADTSLMSGGTERSSVAAAGAPNVLIVITDDSVQTP